MKQLKAHEAVAEKLKEYFDDKMTETERTNYEFLQDSPKTIIDGLNNELQGFSISNFLRTILNIHFTRYQR